MLRSSNAGFWLKGVLIFPLISGLLLLLGWPPIGIFPLLFIGLAPLLLAFDEIDQIRRGKYLAVFLASFIGHFLWIGYSLKWLQVTSPQSYLTAISLETLSLSLATIPAIWVGKKYGKNVRFIFFASAWLSVEFLNQNWLLGTPYFTLGNGFGMNPKLIQHYEFIGVEGGTVWLLASNFFIYKILVNLKQKKAMIKYGSIFSALVGVPIIVSLLMYSDGSGGENKKSVTVLHTFLDPNTVEFSQAPERMTDSLFDMSIPALEKKTDLVVWPEVVINNLGWLMSISQEKAFLSIYKRLEQYPNTTICTGGYGFSLDKAGKENPYASYDSINKYYYVTHNIALSVTYGERSPMRSKENFVPFQERIPLLEDFPFMANFADIVGSNAKITYYPKGVEVHKTKSGITYTPVLCYESVFPLDMTKKAKEVEMMTISANENWNKDLSGSVQYLYNNVGMAIQSRVPLVKSSNSGISSIIDKYGNVLEQRKGRNIGLITQSVEMGSGPTVYSMISSLFYWAGVLIFIPLFILFIFSGVTSRFGKLKK